MAASEPSGGAQTRDGILYVGIDTGTSQSSVVTSAGVRKTVASVVGWPKDLISYKFLKKQVVIGEECLRARMAVDMIWPLEHGVFRHRPSQEEAGKPGGRTREAEAVDHLVTYLLDLAQPADGQEIRAVVGCPARASAEDRQALIEAFRGKVDYVLVASEPFLVAYGLDMFNNSLVIDIGAGTLDLCRMHGTIPGDEDQRTLLKAGNYVDARFHMLLQEKVKDSPISLDMARRIKEQYAFVSSQKEVIYVDFQVGGKPKTYDVTEELREACESILPELISSARELIITYDPEYQQELRQNILLAGGGSQIRGLAEEVRSNLTEFGPCKVGVIDDPIYGGAAGALKLALDMPDLEWERAGRIS
ncbi:MAG: MamK family actin-like protein [Candidatus Latescibacterota bacterium]